MNTEHSASWLYQNPLDEPRCGPRYARVKHTTLTSSSLRVLNADLSNYLTNIDQTVSCPSERYDIVENLDNEPSQPEIVFETTPTLLPVQSSSRLQAARQAQRRLT